MEETKYRLSLDLGFKRLGWAGWQDDRLETSGCFVWRDYDKGNEPFVLYRDERLLDLAKTFDSILHYEDCCYIIIEQFPLNNLTTQRALTAMCLAVIRVKANQYKANWHEISAQDVKFATTGDRKATKARMRRKITSDYPEMLSEGWSMNHPSDYIRKFTEVTFDEVDAVAVGSTWLSREKV